MLVAVNYNSLCIAVAGIVVKDFWRVQLLFYVRVALVYRTRIRFYGQVKIS